MSSECRYCYSPLDRDLLTMLFNPLNLVKGLSGQVALSTLWTADDRNILNDEKLFSLAVTPGDTAEACPFFTADIANHQVSPSKIVVL
jgi:hypothetical protein